MTIPGRVIWTFLSLAAGVVIGLHAGFYGPILLGLARGHDPIHTGWYGDWIIGLMYSLPILLGLTLGVLAWRRKWRRGLIISQIVAVAMIAWEMLLYVLRQ